MKNTVDMNTTPIAIEDLRGTAHRRMIRGATVAAAAALATLVWIVAVPVAGMDLAVGVGSNRQSIGAVSVVLASLFAGGVGWALLALCERLHAKGRRLWQWLAWGVVAISLLGPISMGGAGSVLAVLLLMHVLTGAAVIVGLLRVPTKG